MQETWVWSLGWEDPLEKRTATNSSILAWRIPWIVLPMGSQTVRLPLHILPIKNHHLSVIIFKKKWMMVLFSLMFPLCWIVIASYSPRAANLRCLFCVSLCLRKHCSLFVFLHVQVKAWTLFVCSFLSRSKDDFQKTSWRPWGICLR